MHRRQPLGLASEPPPTDGIAPWAAARTSGPTSTVTGGPEPVAARPRPSSALSGSDIGSAPFEVEDQVYRLRRNDTPWRRAANEVTVLPHEAVAVLERALGQDPRPVRLAPLLEAALARLAGLHDDGIYVLLRLRPEGRRERVAAPAPPPPPRPSAAAVIVRSERRPIEEPEIPIAQATALKKAAALGVPFCEVCARAAAQRSASPG